MKYRPSSWSVLWLAITALLGFSACDTEPVDPTDPPAFALSGTLTVDGNTFNLGEWEQGPSTYSTVEQAVTVSFVKANLGSFSLFVKDIPQSSLVATHPIDSSDKSGGLLSVTVAGSPQAGNLSGGSLTISKNDAFQNPLPTTEIRLLSGSFSGQGTTTLGASFTFSGDFENAQATFQ